MNKQKLLITEQVDESQLGPLEKYFAVEKRYGIAEKELMEIVGDYEAILTRSSTTVTEKLLEKAAKLRIVGRAGIGVDNIDIPAATARNIAVINAPKGNARATAEHTIGLIFSLLRHIPQAYTDLRKGIWGKHKYVGTQLYGKTLGLVGFGNVGRDVYRIAKGLGMNVIVCEPYMPIPKNVKKVTFETLLAMSDIVSLHVPATYLTKHMINKHTVMLCKPGSYLINASRGAVVDEQAVVAALQKGHLAGFAVDVYKKEPAVAPMLLKLPNVIATPHIAGSTVESKKQSVKEVVTGIVQFVEGKAPPNLLNPQVFQKKNASRITKQGGFDAIIFDCDSTLCSIEGIDELAAMVGKKDEIVRLTNDAMGGKSNLEKVYKRRLEIVRPTTRHIEDLGELYIKHIVDDARETVEALRELGKRMYIVSNGYYAALQVLGVALGIPQEHVFGNDLLHNRKGEYLDIIQGPLIRNHGKLQILRQIPGRKLMIGDSVTDWETREVVDLFVGYGGIKKRDVVASKSDVYIHGRSLLPALIIAAGFEGCVTLLSTKFRKHIGKGTDLLFHEKHVSIHPKYKKHFEPLKKLAYY